MRDGHNWCLHPPHISLPSSVKMLEVLSSLFDEENTGASSVRAKGAWPTMAEIMREQESVCDIDFTEGCLIRKLL